MPARSLILSLVPGLLLGACALAPGGGRLPERIVLERGGFIPEGIEFDTTARRLLVGSLVEGTVFAIGADGSLTPFVEDAELVSSAGIEADEPRDRLLVANADRASFGGEGPGIAKLGVYRLSTGERIAMVDLGPSARPGADDIVFVNDVAVDTAGNVYLTDTFMNLIYRVGPDYTPSVFYRFEETPGLGLNGIVHHPDGYLIVVAVGGQGLLYKVPLDAPASARPIALGDPAIGADGLVFDRDGRLIAVSNSSGMAQAYVSNDGWETAHLDGAASFDGQATTGAAVDGDIYVVQPHFDDDEPPVVLRVRP